jgi:hypothetical protein
MEQEADRRAIEGVDEPVFHKGTVVGHIRKYSDTLLIFRLKALAPAKYRETIRQEHSGPEGGPLQFMSVADAIKAAAEEPNGDGG